MQSAKHFFMIRPSRFGMNAETMVNNSFQQAQQETDVTAVAIEEFDRFVETLKNRDIDVLVIDDSPEPWTPDAVFPNNWISFHEEGLICLYPMFAVNRRMERKPAVLEKIAGQFLITDTIDLSHYESKNLFLEGTGSMVIDRINKIIYAGISARTNRVVLDDLCERLNYRAQVFHSTDKNGHPVYHTNVVMCMADEYAVVCLASIKNEEEKCGLINLFRETGKKIIEISLGQMHCFAGNMLQVRNVHEEKLLIMSTTAYRSLNKEQIDQLSSFNEIIHCDIPVIEKYGGGSVRCMIAEIFLDKR